MALHLVYSNNIHRLADRLSETLANERRKTENPFASQTLLVPNPHLAKWLQVCFCQRTGLSMNIDFPFLEKGLWELAIETWGGEEGWNHRHLEREKVQLLVLAEFLDSARLERLPLFKDYLSRQPGLTEAGRVRRAWQLSERLARLFSDYEYHRGDWIEQWLATPGRKIADTVEVNERDLYLTLFGPEGSARKLGTGGAYRTLPQLVREIAGGSSRNSEDLSPLHLFGFSQLSHFHLDLVFRLAKHRQVSLYQFNHSPSLWAEPGIEMDGPTAVAFWGKPGVEFVQLIEDFSTGLHSDIEFAKEFLESPKETSPSLLASLQDSIRHPMGMDRSTTSTQDVSLQILGCPGRYREVETVYQSILQNMRTQPDLQLTDIAVLVTDMNPYKPIVESVFNNPEHRIAFNLSDSTADKDSHFAMALRQLLDLADSRFTRRDVFDFLFNPLAQEAFEVTREEVEEWLQWSDGLNLFSSSPGEDAPPFSWESGFRRLALGRVMETPKRGDDGCLPNYRGVAPYSDLDSQDSDSLGRFVRAVDSLQVDLKRFSKESLSAEVWIDRLHELIEKFVRIPSDRSEENTVRESLFYSLRDLEMLEGEGGIPFAVFRQFVDGFLRNLPSQRGRFLTGGVTVSSMRPLRPIPFKIIYVLGLDEGNFPGVEEDSTLDLRRRDRRPGDVTIPEANRYLFLETLMVAGEKLYLTYPNRDLQKDREIAPCSVVEELKRVAERRLGGKEFEEFSLPISSASREYLRPSPEWTDARVNLSGRDRFLCLLALKGEGRLDDRTRATLRDWVQEHFEEPPEFEPGDNVGEERVSVRLAQLKDFLANPLEAAIRFQLGLSDDGEEDPGLKENEPFLSAFPADYQILVESLQNTVGEGGSIDKGDSFLSNLYDGMALCGETPSGVFGNLDREGFEGTVLELVGDEGEEIGLASFLQQLGGAEFFKLLQIGESDAWIERTMELPPVPFSIEAGGKKWEIELHGELPLVWRNEDRVVALTLAPTSSCKNDTPSKHLLAPFLFYHSLLASEAKGGGSFVGHRELIAGVQFKDGIRLWKFSSTPRQATDYLQNLLVDFLSPSSFGRLPLAAFGELNQGKFEKILEILQHPDPDEESQNLFEELLLEALDKEESGMFRREMELAAMLETGWVENPLEVSRRRLLPFLLGQRIESLEAVE